MANTMADHRKKRCAIIAAFFFVLSAGSFAQTNNTTNSTPAQVYTNNPAQYNYDYNNNYNSNNVNNNNNFNNPPPQPSTNNPILPPVPGTRQPNSSDTGAADKNPPPARDFVITPSLLTEETYNDNVTLQPSGGQLYSSFITEITPRLVMVADGPRFKMNFDYSVQHLSFEGDLHTERTNQALAATSTTELVSKLLYLDDSANINQISATPFGNVTPNNLSVTDNRLTLRTLSISPYLKTETPDMYTELRLMRDFVNTSYGALTDSDSNTVSMTVKNGPAFKTVDWGLVYNDQTIYYPNQNSIVMESILANTGLHVSPEFALTASAGYEKNNYISIYQTDPEGADWSLGFDWTPSTRTHVAASAGRHFYGDTYMLNASEKTFASVWSLGYTTGLTTSRNQFLVPATSSTVDFLNSLWQSSIPDAAQRQLVINAFIQNTGLPASLTSPVNTISDQVFLQKDLQGSVALTGAKNTVLFSFFDLQRNAQTAALSSSTSTDNFNLLNDTRQRGLSLIWNHTLSPRTNTILMDSYSRSVSASNDIAFNSNIITTSLNYQLTAKLKLTLQYERIADDSNYLTGNFIQDLISAMATFSF